MLIFSVLGVAISLGLPQYPAADPKAGFPKFGPLHSIRLLFRTRNERMLWTSIWAKSFFWFLGSLQVMVINALGVQQFGFSKSITSGLIVLELTGMIAGSLVSARISRRESWYNILIPSLVAIAGLLFLVSATPWFTEIPRNIILIVALVGLGMGGALFSIPLTAFIQLRAKSKERGSVIAAASFLDFCAILLSTPIYNLLEGLEIKPSNSFAVMGLFSIVIMPFLFKSLYRRTKNV